MMNAKMAACLVAVLVLLASQTGCFTLMAIDSVTNHRSSLLFDPHCGELALALLIVEFAFWPALVCDAFVATLVCAGNMGPRQESPPPSTATARGPRGRASVENR